jgi:hypothetical protein
MLSVLMILGATYAAPALADQVTCESQSQRRAHCSLDTRGDVWIVEQLSRAPCVEGDTWGVSRHEVWVERGCRAVFESDGGRGRRDDDRYRDDRYRDDRRDDDRYRHEGSYDDGRRDEVTCESVSQGRTECAIDTRGDVRIKRQLSKAQCIEGRSWGVTRRGVWVDSGCRAVFVSEGGRSGGYYRRGDD